MQTMPTDFEPIELRKALVSDAAALADMVICSGENLITHAFGGSRREALLSVEALCRHQGTMFSFNQATLAVRGEADKSSPIGAVISHTSSSERLSSQALSELLAHERGWLRQFRMLPIAIALAHCSEPIPFERTYVSILVVRPEMRSQGIGAQLLRSAEADALVSCDRSICLDVEIDNPRAIAFYERMGYRTVSERIASRYLQRKGIAGMRRMEKML